jgi:hypothetical protein
MQHSKISLIGGLSGPAGLILARHANVQGISVCSMQMFEAMNREVFGCDEVHAAYKHMASGPHFGKIVVHAA